MNLNIFKRLFKKEEKKTAMIKKVGPQEHDRKEEFKTYNSTIVIKSKKIESLGSIKNQ